MKDRMTVKEWLFFLWPFTVLTFLSVCMAIDNLWRKFIGKRPLDLPAHKRCDTCARWVANRFDRSYGDCLEHNKLTDAEYGCQEYV